MAEGENKKIKKAVKELDEVSMSDKEREMYEARLKWEFNYKAGMAGAREAGIKEGIKEIAKEMLKYNMPIETICQITKLSKEEIEEIRNNN